MLGTVPVGDPFSVNANVDGGKPGKTIDVEAGPLLLGLKLSIVTVAEFVTPPLLLPKVTPSYPVKELAPGP